MSLWMTWWGMCCNNNFIICFYMAIKQAHDPLKYIYFCMWLFIHQTLDEFMKVIYSVVYNSPLHSRGIGLEGETRIMVLKRKLDGNSRISNKNVCTINLPITNYLLPSTYQNLDMYACLHSIIKSTTKC